MYKLTERLRMVVRRLRAMPHKRHTVYLRHSVEVEGYTVAYIDNNINLPVRILDEL